MGSWIEPGFALPAGVRVLTTLRHGLGQSKAPFDHLNLGSRCGDDPADVQANRQALADALALPSPPHWLRQVHGTHVVRFEEGRVSEESATHSMDPDEPEADAAVTATRGVVLAVLTADCLPVAFVSQAGDEVAVAHAGWRGLVAGVLENTVAAMHTPADHLIAWLGPAAGPCIYEIGTDVRDAFLAADHAAEAAFSATRPDHWRIDLYAIARQRLAQAGVTEVHGGDRCTISEPEAFFSHRRDQRSGRIATLAWMERP